MSHSRLRIGDFPSETRNRLEEIVDRFEGDWQRGTQVALDSYLPDEPTERHAVLRELVLVETELRQQAGEDVVAGAYLRRYPELGEAGIEAEITESKSLFERPSRSESVPDVTGHTTIAATWAFQNPPARSKAENAHSRVMPVIPGYEVLEELGRGGMGVVYRARETRLNRPCALKMILAGVHASRDTSARFLAEAAIVARLRHANIVHVHALGEHEGRPFFEMEYVEAGSLDRLLDGTPRPPLDAARLVEPLVRAVAEAHRLGIIHRDLKPANVLLTSDGTPKVTDFGLAKCLDADSGLTGSELVLGTPSYMAPEQAGGKSKLVGPLADVYALGAILYELLTGRPPHRAATVLETLELVKNTDPVAPSRLVPGVPRDIETICLKCLQKDPARRYLSSDALAEDLRRFVAGETIHARPVGPVERTWRWAKRKPLVALLTAAVAALLVVVAVGASIIAVTKDQSAKDVARALRRETDALKNAERTLADMSTSRGLLADERGDPSQAALWFANAAAQSTSDDDRIRHNLIRARLWSHKSPIPTHAMTHSGQSLGHIAFTVDGRYLLTVTQAGRQFLWDLESATPLDWARGDRPLGVARLDPRGNRIAVALPEGAVELRSVPSGAAAGRIAHPAPIRDLVFSPDGRLIAVAGGRSVRVWDAKTLTPATSEMVHPATVTTLSFPMSGDRLATSCEDGKARVFAVKAGPDGARPLFEPVPHGKLRSWMGEKSTPPLFADSGNGLITLDAPNRIAVRNAATGEVKFARAMPGGDIYAMALGPFGRRLALGGWCWALTFDVTQNSFGPGLRHSQQLVGFEFSPDSKTIVSLCDDRVARAWSMADSSKLPMPLPHQSALDLAAYSADGLLLATAQKDGVVRVWRLPVEPSPLASMPNDSGQTGTKLSPDGRWVIAARVNTTLPTGQRRVRVYEAATGKPVGPYLKPDRAIRDAALSPDNRTAALAVEDPPGTDMRAGSLQFWSIREGVILGEPVRLPATPERITFSPDGKLVAMTSATPEIVVVDAVRREIVNRVQHESREPWPAGAKVLFTSDGRTIVTALGRSARVWDPTLRTQKLPALPHSDSILAVAASPDSRWLATGSNDGELRVWDLTNGRLAAPVMLLDNWMFQARFSPDGHLLAVACRDGTAQVWDWAAGRLACSPMHHEDEVWSVAFTADSRGLVSASRDGVLRVWECQTGKPLTPAIPLGTGGGDGVEVSPNGEIVVVGTRLRSILSFRLSDLIAPWPARPEDVLAVSELASGRRIHQGEIVGLGIQEWLGRWNARPLRTGVGETQPRTLPASGAR
jgi:eukaryotic-like serine/threonine-protein kinase